MKQIITDTNIWYSITQNQIDEISKSYRLTIPITVLSELYTSPNIFRSEDTLMNLKSAVNIILYNARFVDFIKHDPFEYILKDNLPELDPRLSVAWYLNEFEALKNLTIKDLAENHPERFDISGLTNYINQQSIVYKERVDKNKQAFKKLDTTDFTINFILKLANDNLKTINPSFPEIKTLGEDYELLITALNELLREISRSNQKLKDNDWIDMFNLTYVGKDDLYWTYENSKKRLIKTVGLESYLFNYGSS
jgi:hypothetical protein